MILANFTYKMHIIAITTTSTPTATENKILGKRQESAPCEQIN